MDKLTRRMKATRCSSQGSASLLGGGPRTNLVTACLCYLDKSEDNVFETENRMSGLMMMALLLKFDILRM